MAAGNSSVLWEADDDSNDALNEASDLQDEKLKKDSAKKSAKKQSAKSQKNSQNNQSDKSAQPKDESENKSKTKDKAVSKLNDKPKDKEYDFQSSNKKMDNIAGSTARFLDPSLMDEDMGIDRSLRPKRLDEYIGQTRVKDNLKVLIEASLQRRETLDHILFSGPPGLGKTTLAAVVANEMGVNIKTTSGPAIERPGDLASILTNLEAGDVLFIDEIHRLNHAVEEVLYPAMEDCVLDIVIGKGPAARSLRLDLVPFTLVGATTRTGLLTGPLRDRFGMAFRLDYYTIDELAQIVKRSAHMLGVGIEDDGAIEVASRSRGTPRLANRLLKRVRDFAEVKADGFISNDVAAEALAFFDVDELGLDVMDNRILEILTKTFGGRPVGLSTLASALGEDAGTIEDVYEPFLLQCGLIDRTTKGRVATKRAFDHLGLVYPTE